MYYIWPAPFIGIFSNCGCHLSMRGGWWGVGRYWRCQSPHLLLIPTSPPQGAAAATTPTHRSTAEAVSGSACDQLGHHALDSSILANTVFDARSRSSCIHPCAFLGSYSYLKFRRNKACTFSAPMFPCPTWEDIHVRWGT